MSDFTFFSQLSAKVEQGEKAVLCLLADSFGSTPRRAGAMLAVTEPGALLGTVGGGTSEKLAIEQCRALLRGEKKELYLSQFAMDGTDPSGVMVCGGGVTLGFCGLSFEDLPTLQALTQVLEKGTPTGIAVDFAAPRLTLCPPPAAPCLQGSRFAMPLELGTRLYLFGGGHVGQALVPLLGGLDFLVTVLDDREEIAHSDLFPLAHKVLLCDFEHIHRSVTLTPQDYVVVMSHGHSFDNAIIRQALACGPAYLGCMGSRRKRLVLEQTLTEAGFSASQIASVQLPIGLSIGAETPAEIAVSVAAQLIQHRAAAQNGRSTG